MAMIFVNLIEIFNENGKTFRSLNRQTNLDISNCKQEEEKLQLLLKDGMERFQETKDNILKTKTVIDEVHKHFEDLLQDLESQWVSTEKVITQGMELVQDKNQQLQYQKKLLEKTLQSNQVTGILTTKLTPIQKFIPPKRPYQMMSQNAKYIPGTIVERFDNLYQRPNPYGQFYKGPEYKLVHTYQIDLPSVTKIIKRQNNSAILGSYTEGVIEKITFDDSNTKVEKTIYSKVFDMALMPCGGLLLSTKESDIKVLKDNGDIINFHSFSQFLTFGIHIKNQKEILVGVAKNSKTESGKIVVLNMDGKVLRTYENDAETGDKLFTCPIRIATNYNNTVCVIDTFGTPEDYGVADGRIVVIDEEGRLQWSYSPRLFWPNDIGISSNGLIVIANMFSNFIYAFSEDGQIVGQMDARKIGFSDPSSFDFDEEDRLYIIGRSNCHLIILK